MFKYVAVRSQQYSLSAYSLSIVSTRGCNRSRILRFIYSGTQTIHCIDRHHHAYYVATLCGCGGSLWDDYRWSLSQYWSLEKMELFHV